MVFGHKKHIFDRLFKQLERDFCHKNVYKMGQLMNICNISDTVTPVLCTIKDFFNWGKHLDMLYKRPGSVTVQLNHICMATDTKPRCLSTEVVKGVDSKLQNMTKLKKNETGGKNLQGVRSLKITKLKMRRGTD